MDEAVPTPQLENNPQVAPQQVDDGGDLVKENLEAAKVASSQAEATASMVGEAAAGQTFHMDASGNIETPNDTKERMANGGRPTNETATKI